MGGHFHQLNIYVEDHIATTPTEHGRSLSNRVCSCYSVANAGLLVGIILLSNGVRDQTYPHRHVAVRIVSLGKGAMNRSLCDRSEHPKTETLHRRICQVIYSLDYPRSLPVSVISHSTCIT